MRKVCDIAKWNTVEDYTAMKKDGIDAVIIKAINKSLNKEDAFEKHLKGSIEAGIKVLGTYHYSYANTVEKAKAAVQAWLKAVNGRCNIFFLDWEDACLPKDSKAIEIINVYAEAIHRAGHEFALYCGLSWYNSYLKKYNLPYEMWIARYYAGYLPFKSTDNVNEKYKPAVDNLIGWQYTSSGKVEGIKGNVDINIWYEDICTEKVTGSMSIEYNPFTEPTQNVKLGSMGNDANWVLWYLWRFGMLTDSDGIPDSRMIDGVINEDDVEKTKQVQATLNLQPDGIVGIHTRTLWKKIC